MKRALLFILVVIAAGILAVPPPALAQYGGGDIIPGGSPEPELKREPYQPEDESQPKKRADATCPSAAVLADANRSTVFDGHGRDVTNILYQAQLSDPVVDCKHRKGNQLNITAKAVIGVELGLAAETHEFDVPYFIAVIDPEEMVVTKEQGTAHVKIERGSRTAALTIESDTIKLALDENTMGSDLEVLVGLQLDQDQLGYNRIGH